MHGALCVTVVVKAAFTLGINGIYSGRKFNPISPRNPVVVTVLDGNNNAATHQQSSVGSEGWSTAPSATTRLKARKTRAGQKESPSLITRGAIPSQRGAGLLPRSAPGATPGW